MKKNSIRVSIIPDNSAGQNVWRIRIKEHNTGLVFYSEGILSTKKFAQDAIKEMKGE